MLKFPEKIQNSVYFFSELTQEVENEIYKVLPVGYGFIRPSQSSPGQLTLCRKFLDEHQTVKKIKHYIAVAYTEIRENLFLAIFLSPNAVFLGLEELQSHIRKGQIFTNFPPVELVKNYLPHDQVQDRDKKEYSQEEIQGVVRKINIFSLLAQEKVRAEIFQNRDFDEIGQIISIDSLSNGFYFLRGLEGAGLINGEQIQNIIQYKPQLDLEQEIRLLQMSLNRVKRDDFIDDYDSYLEKNQLRQDIIKAILTLNKMKNNEPLGEDLLGCIQRSGAICIKELREKFGSEILEYASNQPKQTDVDIGQPKLA
jgi:hypothetical protein